MNFSQLHERLRLELLRRIDRGVLSGALLARQTGFRQAHISNFLHRKRKLSLAGLDRILASQMLSVTELLQLDEMYARAGKKEQRPPAAAMSAVPIVAHAAAIYEPRPAAQAALQIPTRLLDHLRSRRAPSRRDWSRFVAIRISPQQAAGMDPVLFPNTLAVIDRHYNALISYRATHPSLFAVRSGNTLHIRYASFEVNRLVLRPYNLAHPVQLLSLAPQELPSDLVVGRVGFTITEL